MGSSVNFEINEKKTPLNYILPKQQPAEIFGFLRSVIVYDSTRQYNRKACRLERLDKIDKWCICMQPVEFTSETDTEATQVVHTRVVTIDERDAVEFYPAIFNGNFIVSKNWRTG